MNKALRIGAMVLAGVVVAAVAGYLVWKPEIDRLRLTSSLFTGAEQHRNFNRMYRVFPSREMAASGAPVRFASGRQISLPEGFVWQGREFNTAAFLRQTDTVGLLVLHSGRRVYENYWLTGGEDTRWMSMSVAKSFVSALVGIAVAEGHIGSIEEPVTRYVEGLGGSAYDNVRIKDILQMSSGARWNEDYGDPQSDINRFAEAFALGRSLNEFAATLVGELPPGSFNRYNSTDTQVLGMLLVSATGRSIAEYMEEKLWRPLGAEHSAWWLMDDAGMELAFGGMNATARDYAKLGELYRLNGRWGGRQLVPEEWVRQSVTPDAPHLMPGADNEASDFPLGYGYQWWIPEGNEGVFAAIGVYNQFIYINPTREVVIVKLSANQTYGTAPQSPDPGQELQTLALLNTITKSVSP